MFHLCTIFAFAVISLSVTAEDVTLPPDNKGDCVNKLVDWCDKMKYSKDEESVSILSVAVTDSSGKLWRVFCSSDSDGTNCTKNRSPWFSCSPDNKLVYEGKLLKKDSTDGVNDDICNATKIAFNEIGVQNFVNSGNFSTVLDQGLEMFFDALADLQQQFNFIRNRIFNPCFLSSCDEDVPEDDEDSVTVKPESNNSNQNNQLERENKK